MGNDGTIVGSPTFGAVKFSNGLTATSASNYISLPSGTFLFGSTDNWTLEAWLTTTGTSTLIAIGSGTNGTANAIWFGVVSGKFACSVVGSGAFTGGAALDSGISINDGSLHHCVVVMSAGTTLTMFVDGVKSSNTYSGVFTPPSVTVGGIGVFPVNLAAFAWNGKIDEVALWTTVKYTVNFSVPVAAYAGNESGLRYLYHLESNATDSQFNASATILADDTNILYTGRWAQIGSAATSRAKTITAGSFLDVVFTGSLTCIINFDETGLTSYPDIVYQIDGGPFSRVTLSTGAGMLVTVSFPVSSISTHKLRILAEGITEGSTPSINQWTSQAGALIFKSLTIDSGGSTLPISASPNILEVTGDSIVASVRQLSTCGGGSNSNSTCMAAHNSWSMQIGAYLGLRVVMSGYGGTGVTVAGSGSVPIANTSFPLVYSGVNYSPTLKPVVVISEHGTNDTAASGVTFIAAYTTYLNTIRAAYPLAFIFCIGLPSNTHASDVNTVVTNLADSRIFYYNYTALTYVTTDSLHPNTDGATVLAAKIASDIQTKLNALGVILTIPTVSSGGTTRRVRT